MSKAVMLSIKPEWCEKIANGTKTVEIRKTRPKIETPFKCYIYCTKSNKCLYRTNVCRTKNGTNIHTGSNRYKKDLLRGGMTVLNGKVIGEFVCDYVDCHGMAGLIIKEDAENTLKGTCLNKSDIQNYLGYDKDKPLYEQKHYNFYGWHISELVIYDKPKKLDELKKPCVHNHNCCTCIHWNTPNAIYQWCDYEMGLVKAPQSWCYVEDGGADNG